jgi:hypothetical protein
MGTLLPLGRDWFSRKIWVPTTYMHLILLNLCPAVHPLRNDGVRCSSHLSGTTTFPRKNIGFL